MKPALHVEVVQKVHSNVSVTTLRNYVISGLRGQEVHPGTLYKNLSNDLLFDNVESVRVCERSNEYESGTVMVDDCELFVHIFKLDEESAQSENIESGDGDGEEICAASHWVLPSRDFHGLWEQLIYESNIKHNLLQYMETTLLFSERCVNTHVITWNRVVLLHGPPGTGKTSLCKALAHKLAIRLSNHYTYGQLLEVNSHSLFSKWFSESGKLVMRMFSKVKELVENPNAFIVVLIDEVESLAHARSRHQGSEPSDAIRTVNALLTQIDILKKYPNVLIVTTSNVTGAIDLAFVDRADIKQYIGPPPLGGIYLIFSSCIAELMRVSIITPSEEIYQFDSVQERASQGSDFLSVGSTENSLLLYHICKECEGLSGRSLRKLPFLAHAIFLQRPVYPLIDFLGGLKKAVEKHKSEVDSMKTQQT